MGKPKVLMIGPARSVHGGISGVVNNYYEAGLQEQIELCYIGTMTEGSKLHKLLKAGCALVCFAGKLPFYRIVHVNVASDASLARKSYFIRLAKLFGKKLVIHQHGGDIENYYRQQPERGQKRIREIFNRADVLLVLSPVLEHFFKELVEPSKVQLFPNAVMCPPVVQKSYGQQKLLFLGRLCKEKGLAELFEVLPELHEEFPQMHLYLGGIWEDEALREQAEQMNGYVTELGWIQGEEKREYLQSCDIFVFPTYFEGQPVSVLEAMAYRCGIVASAVGGIPQMITDGQTGLFIEPKEKESLKSALRKLLAEPELCRTLGEAAGEKVKREFSLEKSVSRLTEIYRELAD